MIYFPDSNIFVTLIKRRIDPAHELVFRYGHVNLATCGMVRTEVLRGIRPNKIHDRVQGLLDVMMNVHTSPALWEAAAALGRQMMLTGTTIKGPDLIIAASAMHMGATVVTFDSDFSRVPGLRWERPAWL